MRRGNTSGSSNGRASSLRGCILRRVAVAAGLAALAVGLLAVPSAVRPRSSMALI